MKVETVEVPLALDLAPIREQLRALRLACSQIGFALDTAILALDDLASRSDESEPCPVCWGRVNDITPGAKCKNPACVGGRVAVPPIEGNEK